MKRLIPMAALLAACAAPHTSPSYADQASAGDPVRDLAISVLDANQPRSIAESREYCGYLGYDADGVLRSTKPARGTLDGCDIPEPPWDWDLVASWHTHGSYDHEYDSEVPSIDDMIGDLEEGVDGYIATPGGRIWKIDLDTERAFILCDVGCVTADPAFRRDPDFPPAPSYTLFELYERFDEPFE